MDEALALRRLNHAAAMLLKEKPDFDRRQRYYDGDHDLPFAPEGVSLEYMELREQAPINWLPLAMGAPVQRCRVDGFRTGRGKSATDLQDWLDVWQSNRMDARQRIVYTQSMVHGRGIMSVSKDTRTPDRPRVLVESCKRVWIEPDPEDPFKPLYAVKKLTVQEETGPALWLPAGVESSIGTIERGYVYDRDEWAMFERHGVGGTWVAKGHGTHSFGTVPFVPFDVNLDADGVPHSALEPLIPSSDAINTIRFQTLLAMQFSAYRQRVFSMFDPVIRDESGNPVYRKNPDGSVAVDASGNPVPSLISMGRIGVDRALAFPGDTKVYDLDESNLKNYTEVLTEFLVQLFAKAQVPPQYLLSRMANLSGDALAGAESTLSALVSDLKSSWGESAEQVMRLAAIARGKPEPDMGSEVIWADAEARSFGATIDAITKLIGQGFPREAAFEMLPGATPQKVQRWMTMADNERAALNKAVLDQVERDLADGEPDDGAAA